MCLPGRTHFTPNTSRTVSETVAGMASAAHSHKRGEHGFTEELAPRKNGVVVVCCDSSATSGGRPLNGEKYTALACWHFSTGHRMPIEESARDEPNRAQRPGLGVFSSTNCKTGCHWKNIRPRSFPWQTEIEAAKARFALEWDERLRRPLPSLWMKNTSRSARWRQFNVLGERSLRRRGMTDSISRVRRGCFHATDLGLRLRRNKTHRRSMSRDVKIHQGVRSDASS